MHRKFEAFDCLVLLMLVPVIMLVFVSAYPRQEPKCACDAEQLAEILEIADHPYVSDIVIRALEDDVIREDEYDTIRFIYKVQSHRAEEERITKEIARKVVE